MTQKGELPQFPCLCFRFHGVAIRLDRGSIWVAKRASGKSAWSFVALPGAYG